ncbi:hypothetical protein [Desulfitibacter alkalitolerans]|uniref:hypothetical protein n=1 Tax=Desulfitibacter alkalitolerans TaxID=264641 RepID=UPI000686BC9E|nr:hypothetical protein [Desulfitibacter alkalitolerans]
MNKRINIALIAFAIFLGTMLGFFSIGYAMEHDVFFQKNYEINEKGQLICAKSKEIITEENFDPSKVYKVNKYGQTYGSSLFAVSFETEPDLILAKGVDGTIGYIYATDSYGEVPKNPEEALAMQKANAGKDHRVIPLYASDGKTIIGKFIKYAIDIEEINLITADEVN